jgi:uncharacterized YigZ family protein
MKSDSFLTIDVPGIGEIREKGSKFIALAHPIRTEDDVEPLLINIKEEYPKASHYCYAFKTGPLGEHYRINDDGEPSGTAGKPIIGQISRLGLTNTIVIVIRYFGGTKLGVSGLIQAYKEAAKMALENASYKETVVHDNYELSFSYADMGHIMAVLKELPVEILDKSFENSCIVTFSIRKSMSFQTLTRLTAGILRVSTQEVTDPMEIPGCTLKKLGLGGV